MLMHLVAIDYCGVLASLLLVCSAQEPHTVVCVDFSLFCDFNKALAVCSFIVCGVLSSKHVVTTCY